MPPQSPLPARHGLTAARVRTPDRDPAQPAPWHTMGEWLRHKLPDYVDVDDMFARECFVNDAGQPIRADDPYAQQQFVWFHRDLRDEPHVPGEIAILHRDERLVVVDKPPFLSTIPRGRHVMQSVVVRLRDSLGLPELAPVHRLDRGTSGVLMLTTQAQWRGAYQGLFERRAVHKTYWALAPVRDDLAFPLEVHNHIRKERGVVRAEVIPAAPVNAQTLVELVDRVGENGVYRLTPATGRTHQLRVHMAGLGIPIINDPLYPDVLDIAIDDFSTPLQLLAGELAFTDPVDGTERRFRSERSFPLA
ncbi:pseudouridine synthase [Demequina sp.]|uniref:pseudouridine synthase n=1 Tax=Demequina sp. TaxID=2050685 RepID=UPI003D0E25B5